jgi:hypothetical protein
MEIRYSAAMIDLENISLQEADKFDAASKY